MSQETAELWIRLRDGRSYCERYDQREMAEFVRESMIDRIARGESLICYDGEELELPADSIRQIELLVSHVSRTRSSAVV